MDLDALIVTAQCPPAMASDKELREGLAASDGPARINPDGTGMSSRPGARYKLWLDFNGSVITGTGERQQQQQPAQGASGVVLHGLVCHFLVARDQQQPFPRGLCAVAA